MQSISSRTAPITLKPWQASHSPYAAHLPAPVDSLHFGATKTNETLKALTQRLAELQTAVENAALPTTASTGAAATPTAEPLYYPRLVLTEKQRSSDAHLGNARLTELLQNVLPLSYSPLYAQFQLLETADSKPADEAQTYYFIDKGQGEWVFHNGKSPWDLRGATEIYGMRHERVWDQKISGKVDGNAYSTNLSRLSGDRQEAFLNALETLHLSLTAISQTEPVTPAETEDATAEKPAQA